MTYTDEQRAYHRAYYVKRRQRLFDYLGGVCVVCGSKEDLQFDHVDPSEKTFDIKSNLTLNEVVAFELDKCQLLCRTHHIQKTSSENSGYTHGTIYAFMKKHCSCAVCDEAKWAWYDARNKKRRSGPGYNIAYRRNGETG